MPIEGKRTYIGDQLDPEIDTHLQGKSFTRSVSISESTTDHSGNDKSSTYRVPCGPSSIRPVPPTATAIRSVSGGDIDLLSPSPLSSFTATASSVSADSPYPPNASPVTTTPLDGQVSDIVATIMNTNESSGSTSGGEPSINSFEQRLPSVTQLKALFNDPNSRRTMNLLIHLLDSSLPSGWHNELVRSLSIIGSPLVYTGSDVPDGDFIPSQQAVMSSVNLGTSMKVDESASSDEASVVKRSNLIDSKPPDHTPSGFVYASKEAGNALPKTFISPSLIELASELVHTFESLYSQKLGSLLDDTVNLSRSELPMTSVQSSEGEVTLESSQPLSSGVEDTFLDVMAPSDFLDKAYQRFYTVLSTLFYDRINWGRVVAMLSFIRVTCAVAEAKRIKSDQPTSSDDQQSLIQEAHPTPTQSEATFNSDEAAVPGGETAVSSAEASNQGDGQRDEVDGGPRTATRQFSSSGAAASLINGRRPVAGCSQPTPADYLFWATAFIHQHDGVWSWITANGGWEGLLLFKSNQANWRLAAVAATAPATVFQDDETVHLLRRTITTVGALAVGAVGLAAAVRFFTRRA